MSAEVRVQLAKRLGPEAAGVVEAPVAALPELVRARERVFVRVMALRSVFFRPDRAAHRRPADNARSVLVPDEP